MSEECTTLTTTNTTANTLSPPKEQHEIVLDSLPYIDQIHNDYEDYALSLIQAEMDANQPTSEKEESLLQHLPNVLQNPPRFYAARGKHGGGINEVEYQNLVERNGTPRSASFPFPTTAPPSSSSSSSSSWKKSINNTKIAYEHQRHKLLNLELSSFFDSSLWRHSNATLESTFLNAYQESLTKQRHGVDLINSKRKRMQEEDVGVRLKRLEGRWEAGVRKRVKLVVAEEKLKGEVDKWRQVLKGLQEEEEEKGKMKKDDAKEEVAKE